MTGLNVWKLQFLNKYQLITFEEFFLKKKIDLLQLHQAEPEVYTEFKSHYALMGEKSFDHTKKYWFNKLRRLYHIKEKPKAGKPVEKSAIASQAEPLDSPTKEIKPGYTPRFKAKTPVPEATPVTEISKEEKQTESIPTYKPRFKPGAVVTSPSTDQEKEPAEQQNTEEPTKPAFKPRFKSQLTKPELNTTEEDQSEKEEVKKPAYKPRFNSKNIKPGSSEE